LASVGKNARAILLENCPAASRQRLHVRYAQSEAEPSVAGFQAGPQTTDRPPGGL